jgi:hypothetical protein
MSPSVAYVAQPSAKLNASFQRGRTLSGCGSGFSWTSTRTPSKAFSEKYCMLNAGIIVFLFVFAGLMSGLTLGLMSLGLVDLEVLRRSGSDEEKRQAGKVEEL